jgi:dephospho-CoA kinase
MFILGLTGSIGMGKSATSRMIAARGVPVYDADAAVHDLYANRAVRQIGEVFPDAIENGQVNRNRLSGLVVGNADLLAHLEAIVHPLVREAEQAFLDRAFAAGSRLSVVEVPLLLETGGGARVDAVAVVSAAPEIQHRRVLERPGMSQEKLAAILSRQMPDAEKRRLAHFVIDTGRGFAGAQKAVDDILRALAGLSGDAYARRKAEVA